jgi:PIN domain nuclease of toxin-antitoxin system
MAVLLDTHTFIWYYEGSPESSDSAKKAILNSEGEFYLSIASFWEIAIKTGLGKLSLNASLETLFQDVTEQGYRMIPIDIPHLLQYGQLPFHHRDPFDRLIISQGLAEGFDLISKDGVFDAYLEGTSIRRIWT